MKRKAVVKIISMLLTVALLVSAVPFSAAALDELKPSDKLNFAVMSDLHLYPYSLTDGYCDAFREYSSASFSQEPLKTEALLDCALAGIEAKAERENLKYVIIPGDLTVNGEYEGHKYISGRLERFERETGIQVLIVNGNHDINNYNAASYANGFKEPGRRTTPEDFRDFYKNLGYDLAYHTYVPETGKANMLSYSVRADGYRLIMMDTAKYSGDVTDDGNDKQDTAGCMTDGCVNWVLDEIEDAKACGETVIGFSHHNFVPHYKGEYTIVRGFVVDGWQDLSETFADAGMHYNFTGHIHDSDIASSVSDNGETLFEVACDSLTSFPNYYRIAKFETTDSGKTTLDVRSCDVDDVLPLTVDGITYEQPYRLTSIKECFFKDGSLSQTAYEFALNLLKDYSAEFARDGVLPKLESMGLDIRGLLTGLIGEGIIIGETRIFTVDNLMSFIEDLLNQIFYNYLSDPDATALFLKKEIDKLLSVQMSELPSRRFLEEYGIGSGDRPGTFEDMLACVIIYLYDGRFDVYDDPFMVDVLYQFEYGDVIFDIFDVLLEIVADDLLNGKILADLEFRPETLFDAATLPYNVIAFISSTVKMLLGGDISYLGVTNGILGFANKLNIVEYTSLWGIVEHYMDAYLTDTQLEGVGQTLANIIREFAEDKNITSDDAAVLIYDGKTEVEATRENYRLPTLVSVSLGDDATSRNVSWYTKKGVEGSDIEIVESNGTPVFTGRNMAPAQVKIDAETVLTERQFPGVDLGVAGIMNYVFEMNRHILRISGLEKGKTYYYRVGDAERGWWSETGSFKMEDGGDETSFIHVCDPQSQSAIQYGTFAKVIETAYEMYDSDFIIDTGDCVDHGDNFRQWQWFFDLASDTLMNTAVMSASGNHEDKGTFAIDKNFVYSNVPDQDFSTGIYFSFDCNNVHFAVLNTNNLDRDDSISREQIDWLKKDMQESDADWKFVALHKSPYSNGSHYKDDDVCAIRDELSALMPQLGIDMVFAGHDHVYLRTDSLINNEIESVTVSQKEYDGKIYNVKENPVGTVYVTSGCSGVKVYRQKDASLTDEYFPRAEAIADVTGSMFSGVRISGNTLYFDAYEVNPVTSETVNVDSFAITKDLSVRKGTGVPETCDFSPVLNRIAEIAVQVLLQVWRIISEYYHISVFGL